MQHAAPQRHELCRIWGRVSDVSPGTVGITGVSAHAGLGNEVEIHTLNGTVRGEILNITEWLEAGAHIVTVSPELLKGMIVHPYSKETVQMFLRDAEKINEIAK